ncbi:MAG TPA: ABC transporter permease [Kineosporiaceae bacterium]|nr:ABC transporter permease [Kineosporiaceae bacterium]
MTASAQQLGAESTPAGTRVPTGEVSALPATPRPGALAGRAFVYWLAVYRRVWLGSAISSFLAPLLYLGAMGFGLGTLVNRSGGGIDGVPYAQFVAPGVLAATAMQTAAGESTYMVMGAVKWQRQYHAMLAGPLGPVDLVLGHAAYILVRITLACVAFTLVAAVLGALASPLAVVGLLVAILCGAAHGPVIMAFSARQENDGNFNLLFRFGIIPMFLFAGTFFPVDRLPAWIQPLAWVTPLWNGTTSVRQLTLGVPDWPAIAAHCAYLLAWVAVGLVLAFRSFRARLVT